MVSAARWRRRLAAERGSFNAPNLISARVFWRRDGSLRVENLFGRGISVFLGEQTVGRCQEMRGEGWEMRQRKGPCPGVVDAPPSIMDETHLRLR